MEEKTKNRMMKVGLASICLAMATPLVFAGCSAEPQKGDKGDPGKSAYEIANEQQVNAGKDAYASEQEWLDSLKATAQISDISVAYDATKSLEMGYPHMKVTVEYQEGDPYTTYFPANVDLEFDTIGHSLMGMDVLLGGKIDEKLYDISVRDFNSSEALTKLGTSQTYSLDVLNTKMQYTAVNKLDWYVRGRYSDRGLYH